MFADKPLSYAAAYGDLELRKNISSLYSGTNSCPKPENILVTAGAIAANNLALETIIASGDHVIVQHPTYNQLIEIPRRAGAQISLWKQNCSEFPSPEWTLDIEELKSLVQVNTKLIILNNPSNPTGLLLSRQQLQDIIGIARPLKILIMCDEVFRFLHHAIDVEAPPSILELDYEGAIAVSSISKSFALPGVRVGWIAVHPHLSEPLLRRFAESSDYTTIAVSGVAQDIARFALDPHTRHKILARSKALCDTNCEILGKWAARNRDWISFTAPRGAGACLVRLKSNSGTVIDDKAFASTLALEEGVLVPPAGVCFGHEADGEGKTDLNGYLRIGIVCRSEILRQGLAAIERLRKRWV